MSEASWSPLADVYDPLKAGSIDGTDEFPHDRGIVRAMMCKYKPNKKVVGQPTKTIFVARLNPKTDENTLRRVFSEFGEIKRLRLIRDIVTGFSRGYGFVEYKELYSARKAFVQTNKTLLDGSEIFVDYEQERNLKNWVPRRLGGGFGGNKESGQLRFGGRDRPFKKPILVGFGGVDRYKKRDYKDTSHRNKDSQRKNRIPYESSSQYSSSDYRSRREQFPNREAGVSQGYVSIESKDEYSSRKTFVHTDKALLDGSEMSYDYEQERNLKSLVPCELGSGFVGNKESGQLRFGEKDQPFKKPFLVESGDVDKFKKRDCSEDTPHQNKDSQRENRIAYERSESSSSDYRNRREQFPNRSHRR